MLFFKYLFIFCLFAIVGWILELTYRSIFLKKFVNPGFMSGCVVPIYGFGAVIMNIIISLFSPITSEYKVIPIFIVSVIILTFLEFISGYILLRFFHLKLWDYSMYKYNYNGFVCIEFSFIWGLLALIFYLFIYPWLNGLAINFINSTVSIFMLGIYMGVFLVDLCASIKLLSRFTKYAKELKEIVDVEKLKLDVRKKLSTKKFLNALYPYIYTNRFLRDKIKEMRNK